MKENPRYSCASNFVARDCVGVMVRCPHTVHLAALCIFSLLAMGMLLSSSSIEWKQGYSLLFHNSRLVNRRNTS